MGHGLMNRSVLDWPTGVTVYKPEKCRSGYTTVVPYRSELMFLIDMSGRVVHVWKSHPDERWQSWFIELLPNGNWLTLSCLADVAPKGWPKDAAFTPDTHEEIFELDWGGSIVWNYRPPEGWHLHHDMARLTGGNTLVLAETAEVIKNVSDREIQDNVLAEVTPEGEIVWQWSSAEHFDEFGFGDRAKELIRAQGGDCFHTNTVEALPGNELGKKDKRFRKGNVLCCQRSTNLIFVIDRDTGKVVWKWGTGKGQLVGPHHPTMLSNGNILVYDNGGQAGFPVKHRFFTRLVEVNPADGRIAYEYRDDAYGRVKETAKFLSSSWGSVQRLGNGNTLSLDCHKGRIFEVTPGGEIVWEYISPFQWNRGASFIEAGIYRTYRYGYEQVPQVEAYFRGRDGHDGVGSGGLTVPPGMGLPPHDPA